MLDLNIVYLITEILIIQVLPETSQYCCHIDQYFSYANGKQAII